MIVLEKLTLPCAEFMMLISHLSDETYLGVRYTEKWVLCVGWVNAVSDTFSPVLIPDDEVSPEDALNTALTSINTQET